MDNYFLLVSLQAAYIAETPLKSALVAFLVTRGILIRLDLLVVSQRVALSCCCSGIRIACRAAKWLADHMASIGFDAIISL